MGLFYQLYANDKEGILGETLRSIVQATGFQGTFEDKIFAILVVSVFMQITGILMLPEFLGPTWSPIMGPIKYLATIYDAMIAPPTTTDPAIAKVLVQSSNDTHGTGPITDDESDHQIATVGKKKRKNKKKKA
jgi:hypothetical protein